jgi:hypothetical protein
MTGHKHEVVLIGMINVNRDNYLQGTVDVWRCRQCRKLFCDDKRYGEPLKPSVGFDELPEGEEWAVLTCTNRKEVFMMSLGVKPGKTISHICKTGERYDFFVGDDYFISSPGGLHRIYLVKDHVNKAIEAGYYALTMK